MYLDPATAGTALDLEAGASPDASSCRQFLLSELLWMPTAAPELTHCPPWCLAKEKGTIFTLLCWACFGRYKG